MSESTKIYLIYSPAVEDRLELVIQHELIVEQNINVRNVKLSEMSSIHIHDGLNHALLWVEQKDYPQALQIAYQKKMSLGFLPVTGDKLSQFLKNLDLPEKFNDCLEEALHEKPFPMDLIECNGEIVINGVNLENQTTMSEFVGDSNDCTGINKIKFQFTRFFHAFSLTPHPVTIVTGKEKKLTTAITGMVLLDFHKKGALLNQFKESISLRDRRISVVFFAPQSILSYLHLSFSGFLSTKKQNLFQQLGYIRTESLMIQTSVDTHYLVNNKPLTTRELHLKTLSDGLFVNAGEAFRKRQEFSDDKENISCDYLPQQEDRVKYLSGTLPFFPHAVETDFKELFLTLKESANMSGTYILLMVLSSLLATLGLFLNSPSVVIGAMVLAPLMSPIISGSMGMLRSDLELSRKAFSTLFIGMMTALSLSALMAYILPFQDLTNEIEGRLHPSTLDLLVAVLSGVAGAFANANENIAKSLPGVAIAVALVPPLCVSGIGIGWLNYEVFYGAMLLFLTNLTGIIMAAGLSFMVMGFAPFSRAKKGIMISVFLVAMISVPLFLSFENMQKMAEVKKQLHSQNYEISGHTLQLRNIKLRAGTPLRVSADLLSTQMLDAKLLSQFEQQLSIQLKQPVKVNFSVHMITERYL
ncbi:MAG: TIGR00341 family protein [Methylococcales bacterium]|nr:TIGR00341 family protein [Methylococcales bacterium]